jgi:hypothetical protein
MHHHLQLTLPRIEREARAKDRGEDRSASGLLSDHP